MCVWVIIVGLSQSSGKRYKDGAIKSPLTASAFQETKASGMIVNEIRMDMNLFSLRYIRVPIGKANIVFHMYLPVCMNVLTYLPTWVL